MLTACGVSLVRLVVRDLQPRAANPAPPKTFCELPEAMMSQEENSAE